MSANPRKAAETACLEADNERMRREIAQLRAGEGASGDSGSGYATAMRSMAMDAADAAATVHAADEGLGHAAHSEGNAHGSGGDAQGHSGEGHGHGAQAHGDGHDCGVDHGSAGDAQGHSDKGHGHGGDTHGKGHDCGVDHGSDSGGGGSGGSHSAEGRGHGTGKDGEGAGEQGASGMEMKALMAMMGKGAGKGGGGGSGMDIASMMEGMAMGKEGLEDCGPVVPPRLAAVEQRCKDLPSDEKKGEKWVWMQQGEEVQIRFPLDPVKHLKCNKKDINVTFKTNTLKVLIRGDITLDGILGGTVDVDLCTWCFSSAKDELQVMLTKTSGKTDAWEDLLA